MDFNDSQQEAEFRKEAREFLEANAEKRSIISDKPNDKSPQIAVAGAPETVKGGKEAAQEALERAKVWQKKKAEAGFAAILWPKEFGGYASIIAGGFKTASYAKSYEAGTTGQYGLDSDITKTAKIRTATEGSN